ncbi:MAG: aldo/keto reductase [Cyanobacteria bacterium J06639_18]
MKIIDLTPQSIIASPPAEVIKIPQEFLQSDIPFYRKLGRTDLNVSCLGLGGGSGISSEDTLYAFDRGINYFFFSSDLHHYTYSSMSEALRQLCGRGSSVRERVVLAMVSYFNNPKRINATLFDQFHELGIDYIDIFFWGWIGSGDEGTLHDCLQLSPDLKGANSVYQRTIERVFGFSERLKKMGAVRYIGASFHDLNIAQRCLENPLLDILMIRHNIAHRSAQNQIFNTLDTQDSQRPGIITFKSTGSHTGPLWISPRSLPQTCWRPSVPDLYRYSLSQNCVDVCLAGWRRRKEIDTAFAGVEKGKLTAKELDYLNLYGDLHRRKLNLEDIPTEKLLYKN